MISPEGIDVGISLIVTLAIDAFETIRAKFSLLSLNIID